jgi:hypothetical protein
MIKINKVRPNRQIVIALLIQFHRFSFIRNTRNWIFHIKNDMVSVFLGFYCTVKRFMCEMPFHVPL